MAKKNTLSRVKEKAWNAFSKYIRFKYSKNGIAECVTCKKKDYWKNLQAGHAVDSRCNSLLFEEKCVHPQCYVCNIRKKGEYGLYATFIIDTYGRETLEYLRSLKHVTVKYSRQDYINIEEKYTRLFNECSSISYEV